MPDILSTRAGQARYIQYGGGAGRIHTVRGRGRPDTLSTGAGQADYTQYVGGAGRKLSVSGQAGNSQYTGGTGLILPVRKHAGYSQQSSLTKMEFNMMGRELKLVSIGMLPGQFSARFKSTDQFL